MRSVCWRGRTGIGGWIAGLVTVVLVLAASQSTLATDDRQIAAPAAHDAAMAGERALIDVRSPDEWRETGLPAGGIPVTIHDSDGWRGFLDKVLNAVGNDRHSPIALICASGVRSSAALRFLRSQGFTDVLDVSEGMMGRGGRGPGGGWLQRGLPTVPYGR